MKIKIALAISTFFLTLFLLELALRISDTYSGKGFFSTHRNILKNNKPQLPFRTFGFDLYNTVDDVRYISSRRGELYPVEKPTGTFRIVAFGGSTTAQMIGEWHYPKILESTLKEKLNKNIEVINVGNEAYSTAHALILLELDVLSWNPDLVILSENNNDLVAMYWPNFTFDYSNKYGTIYYLPDHRSRFIPSNVFFQHFQLWWVLKEKIAKVVYGSDSGVTSYEIHRESMGSEPNPLAAKVFERNLKSFVSLAKANDVKVILGTQPISNSEELFKKFVQYESYSRVIKYPLHEEFLSHHRAFNKIIEKVAKEENVSLADNAKLMSGDDKYFTDYIHYSAAGLERLAQNYGNIIITSGSIK